VTERLDENLRQLFEESEQNLTNETFADDVMVKVRQITFRQKATWWGTRLLIALVIILLFSKPLQSIGQLITQVLIYPVVELSNPYLVWILLPVNNLACLLLLVGVGFMLLQKKIRNVT